MVDKYNYGKEYYRRAQIKHKVKSLLRTNNADNLKKLCKAVAQLKEINEEEHKEKYLSSGQH